MLFLHNQETNICEKMVFNLPQVLVSLLMKETTLIRGFVGGEGGGGFRLCRTYLLLSNWIKLSNDENCISKCSREQINCFGNF